MVAAASGAPWWASTRACTTSSSTSASRTADGRASTPSSRAACATARAPVDPDPRAVASPADGRIESMGRIDEGGTFVVKGRPYAVAELVGDAQEAAPLPRRRRLRRLPLAARLPPRARARVGHRPPHPVDAGRLLSRSTPSAMRHVPNLFCRNRRVAIEIDADGGLGRVDGRDGRRDDRRAHHDRRRRRARRAARRPRLRAAAAPCARGQEIGVFHLGSTAVVLVEKRAVGPVARGRGARALRAGADARARHERRPPRRSAPGAARCGRHGARARARLGDVARSRPPPTPRPPTASLAPPRRGRAQRDSSPRARRRGRMTLRIPDDEVARPQLPNDALRESAPPPRRRPRRPPAAVRRRRLRRDRAQAAGALDADAHHQHQPAPSPVPPPRAAPPASPPAVACRAAAPAPGGQLDAVPADRRRRAGRPTHESRRASRARRPRTSSPSTRTRASRRGDRSRGRPSRSSPTTIEPCSRRRSRRRRRRGRRAPPSRRARR